MSKKRNVKLEEDIGRICQQKDAILKKPREVNK